jgi:ATP-dependent Clp protease ATP-binding subunit ClpA
MANLPPISEPLRRTLTLAAIVDGNEEEVDILTPVDLLLAVVRQRETNARRVFDALGIDRYRLERMLWNTRVPMTGRRAANMPAVPGLPNVVLSPESNDLMGRALAEAQRHQRGWIETGDLLLALSQWHSTAGYLRDAKVEPAALEALLRQVPVEPASAVPNPVLAANAAMPADGAVAEELPEPAAPRPALLDALTNRLRRQPRGHVLLVGEAGAGKRALVRLLERAVQEQGAIPGMSRVLWLREAALARDPAAAMRDALAAAGMNMSVLVVPNIERFWLATRSDWREAGDMLAEAVWDNIIALVATTTPLQAPPLQALPVVRERLAVLEVPPASPEEARATLDAWRDTLEKTYQVKIESDALDEAVRLARRYITDMALPGSALDLLHQAAALAGQVSSPVTIGTVRAVASERLKIPLRQLEPDERQRFLGLREALGQKVLGQENAVQVLSESLLRAAAGLRDPKRPVGSFLFLGPTGVGKTELAKALAVYLFGGVESLIRLDMSEYMERHQVARLLGAPPGYVGYESGGQLTEAVRKRPYSVVLFDEIEKAHPDVFNLLLQVLDDGRLTDGQGRTVDFGNTVIIMTSNLGSRQLIQLTGSPEEQREAAMEALQEFFRPEFLNRLDEIVIFNPLGPSELRLILDLMLSEETKRAAERGIRLHLNDEARSWLLSQNTQPEWGARPLRRLIQRHLTTPLAQHLLATPGSADIEVTTGPQGLVFTTKPTPAAEAPATSAAPQAAVEAATAQATTPAATEAPAPVPSEGNQTDTVPEAGQPATANTAEGSVAGNGGQPNEQVAASRWESEGGAEEAPPEEQPTTTNGAGSSTPATPASEAAQPTPTSSESSATAGEAT